MRHLEVHGERAQTPVGREPKRRVLVEHFPVEVNANIRLHIFRAVVEHLSERSCEREERSRGRGPGPRQGPGAAYLVGIEPLGHGPGGHDVVHDALAQRLGHLVQLHEFAHVVQHVVVLGGGRRHLLNDGGDVAEYGRVQQGCQHHNADR